MDDRTEELMNREELRTWLLRMRAEHPKLIQPETTLHKAGEAALREMDNLDRLLEAGKAHVQMWPKELPKDGIWVHASCNSELSPQALIEAIEAVERER